jgi:hypothetical protein
VLDVIFLGPKASSVGLDISKLQFVIYKFFICIFVLQFVVIKTLDPDPDSLELLDPDQYPDPDLMYPDAQ